MNKIELIEGKEYKTLSGKVFQYVKSVKSVKSEGAEPSEDFAFRPINLPKFSVLNLEAANKLNDPTLEGLALFSSVATFEPNCT